MKRLTKRIDGKAAFVHGTCYDPQQVCYFLASYEDTGLEPEVCANYKQFEDEAMSKGVTFRRIVELMEAEKEGRLVLLPCNVGDVIFGYPFCWAEETISELGILEWKAACIHYSVNKAGKTRATVRSSVWKEHNGKEYAYLTEDYRLRYLAKPYSHREEAEPA